MSSAVSAKSDISTVTIRGSRGNFTLNLIKAKRHRRELVREEISSGKRKKTDQSRLRRHRFRWLEQCRLVYLGFIDFLITTNAS